ncbi:MAG TPA: CSLREA domain-containing protein, partial [Thermoanaerobaculia bacterium]|nr:CSLREA domain-containing protein [Thermoanaerobaculia bacterium]
MTTLATAMLLALGGALPAAAIVLAVTKTTDSADGNCNEDCSLREAVIASRQLAGPDVIVLGPGVHRLTLGAGEDPDGEATGDLDLQQSVVISGAGASRTAIDAAGIDRAIDVLAGATVELVDLALRNGATAGGGGAIRNAGALSLLRVTVTDSTAGESGGGILSEGAATLTVVASTVSANEAGGTGGGVAAGGSVHIHDATLSGNHSAAAGGGLYVQPGANGELASLTVTANESAVQGGGAQLDAPLPWTSSVVAANVAPLHPDAAGVVASAGFNLWGVADGVTLASGDQGGSAAHPLDPKLAPLAEQGGPTPTHAPLPGSPALDAGAPADASLFCAAFDQRGVRRDDAATGRCDAGAVELTPSCVPGKDHLCLAGGRFEVTARWQSGELAGSATAVPVTDESGSFWFFAASNLELTVKVVDACGAGADGRFWVFSSGLTDTAVTLTVRDTATGRLR